MPLDYDIRSGVIWFVTEGDVDYEDGLETLGTAIREAARRDADQRWDVIFDIRLSSEQRSADELRGIADFVAGHKAVLSGRCAVVAGDAFHFGLGRMFSAYSESNGVEALVARDVGSATSWLNGEPVESS